MLNYQLESQILKLNFGGRDWCAFGNSTFDLEIQTSSFADSQVVCITAMIHIFLHSSNI